MCYARFSEWLNAFFQSSQKKGESIAYVYVLFCFLFFKKTNKSQFICALMKNYYSVNILPQNSHFEMIQKSLVRHNSSAKNVLSTSSFRSNCENLTRSSLSSNLSEQRVRRSPNFPQPRILAALKHFYLSKTTLPE